ncbi:MAG TPA: hypothetical protein VLA42_01260 [Verrucomicrobiae bacterium]|jgi:hypothetical protein|nr:hypothetical protein [Verrucomicrobiae bacterium]
MLRLTIFYRFDQQPEVGRIGNEPAFTRLDGIGESFAGEYLFIQNAETPAIQSERAGVFQP